MIPQINIQLFLSPLAHIARSKEVPSVCASLP